MFSNLGLVSRNLFRAAITCILAIALAACTTTPRDFEQNPKAVSKAALCRTLLETQDPIFQQRIAEELGRRRVHPNECYAMVQKQNDAAMALAAVALVGTAVAVCANGNCGGGNYYRGPCQYPWQRDALGRRCGGRSAWSRPGGY